jgi:hypothetical protein
MNVPASRASRRRLLGVAAAAVPGLALGGSGWLEGDDGLAAESAAAQATATAAGAGRRADPPAWSLTLYLLQDPYAGVIQAPAQPPPGTRYVGAEIEIDNASSQPLAFTPAEVRLRDATGYEYRGGSAVGTEPVISPRNLNGGERSRGWVWFTVMQEAQLEELAYVAPQPQYRIDLPM